MNSIKVNDKIFNNIKESKQNLIISENANLQNGEKIILESELTKDELYACITAKSMFNTLEDALKVFPSKLIGEKSLYKSSKEGITIYRIKIDTNLEIEKLIQDKEIHKIIDINTIDEIKIGRSISKVFKTKMKKDDNEAILKVQYLPSRTSLKEEYERLNWLQDKMNSPKVYYWNEKNEYKYLIMEYKKGKPAFKYDNIGYRLGKELKKIHNIDIKDCKFDNNSAEKLLSNCIEKIEAIFPEIQKKYKDENIKSTIKFLVENIPKDKVLVHGDYSLPNILIDDNTYNFIDLGDVSISTKYFDFYYFLRSLEINKKVYMLKDFLSGYGLEKLESKYMKWMDIVDKALY